MSLLKLSSNLEQSNEHIAKFDKRVNEYNLKSFAPNLIQGSIQGSNNRNNINMFDSTFQNGLIGSVADAYNHHFCLELSPDVIWIAIMTQFNLYLFKYNKELRSKFVRHKDKIALKAFSLDNRFSCNWEHIYKIFLNQMKESIKDNDLIDWCVPSFSTTTNLEKITGMTVFMSTMKSYFSYKVEFFCGIPSVTLTGTVEDWILLREKANKLIDYDNKDNIMQQWCKRLFPVLDMFIESYKAGQTGLTNEVIDWWSKIVSFRHYGSGSTKMSGWITVFSAFDDQGNFKNTTDLSTSQVNPGVVEVDMFINDNGSNILSSLISGLACTEWDNKTRTLKPRCDWWIIEKKDIHNQKNEQEKEQEQEMSNESDRLLQE